MFHRKSLSQSEAKAELRKLSVIDNIDPLDVWHIGHPVVEKHNDLWVLIYPYGGRTLSYLQHESPDTIISIMKEIHGIIGGLCIMHRAGSYHRDIKTSNMVYDKTVKLIDFGTAIGLPTTPSDELYWNIYPIWPFETAAVSGRDSASIFSTYVFTEYISHTYITPILEYHKIDTSEIRENILVLRKRYPNQIDLHQAITKGIDVYSLGIALSHLIMYPQISNAIGPARTRNLKWLLRKMIEPYTEQRMDMDTVHSHYCLIWDIPR